MDLQHHHHHLHLDIIVAAAPPSLSPPHRHQPTPTATLTTPLPTPPTPLAATPCLGYPTPTAAVPPPAAPKRCIGFFLSCRGVCLWVLAAIGCVWFSVTAPSRVRLVCCSAAARVRFCGLASTVGSVWICHRVSVRLVSAVNNLAHLVLYKNRLGRFGAFDLVVAPIGCVWLCRITA
uniref:Uncharacterized protein n=1 Tax=Tanacetum cinerariifolium TaxID=118510 RepID=A0A699KVV6_TANCI|nr:hypothetical protein [Tanacetum cinerariifolium]